VQFERRLREGLHDGSITLALRRWRRVQVVAGHHYRTGAGLVCAEAIDQVAPADITAQDALAAGYPDVPSLLADLRGDASLPLYRIRFRRLDGPDPRDELAAADTLSEAETAGIAARLARMDRASKRGPWTAAILTQIAERPAVSSVFLAEALGWERPDFKVHVRRLKALGLTISLDVGYRLSPRGRAYLAGIGSSAGRDQAAPGRKPG
jgi:biotin operon repressor